MQFKAIIKAAPLVFVLIYAFTHTQQPSSSSSTSQPEFTTIKVITSDDYEMVIPQSIAFQSPVIKNIIGDLGNLDSPIQLSRVSKVELTRIVSALKRLKAADPIKIKREDGGYIAQRIQPIIDAAFASSNNNSLVGIIRAANFLELEYLVNGLVRLLVLRVLKEKPNATMSNIFSFWFVPRDLAPLTPEDRILEEQRYSQAHAVGKILPDKIKRLIEYHYTLIHTRTPFATGGFVRELSIADYIAIHGIPKVQFSENEDEESESDEAQATLNLENKQITSLEGIDEIPNIEKVDQLILSGNKLVFIASNQFNVFTNLKMLDLDANLLSNLPSNLFNRLGNLTKLNLGKNLIKSIPDGLFNPLARLIKLDLTGNQLGNIADTAFINLTKLKSLGLGYNKLESLRNVLFSTLINLEDLGLNNNQLTVLPNNIFDNLAQLKRLSLSFNRLTNLSETLLQNNTRLTTIFLGNNQLVALPGTIFNHLTNLVYLELQQNRLTTLPASLFSGLIDLEEIDLKENRLTTLPTTIFNGLPRLRVIEIGENPITFTFRNGRQFRREFNLRQDVTISYALSSMY